MTRSHHADSRALDHILQETTPVSLFGGGAIYTPSPGSQDDAATCRGRVEDADTMTPDGEILSYLQYVSRIPPLTQADEENLCQCIQRGRQAQVQLARDSHDSAMRERLESVIGQGKEACNQLVLGSARLVVFIARQYIGRGVPLPDLIQEGNLGLMEAAHKFDIQRRRRFSTYAAWWIRHYVRRAIANQGRTIRLPVNKRAAVFDLFRASRRLAQTLGREPRPIELARSMHLPVKQVRWLLQIASETCSLDEPIGESDDSLLGDLVEDIEAVSPSESAVEQGWANLARELVTHLPGREGLVLRLRFGFEDGVAHTLEDIGQMLGVTRERVWKIEKTALQHLRESQAVKSYLDSLPAQPRSPEQRNGPLSQKISQGAAS